MSQKTKQGLGIALIAWLITLFIFNHYSNKWQQDDEFIRFLQHQNNNLTSPEMYMMQIKRNPYKEPMITHRMIKWLTEG